jgi:hypothetical protein
MSAKRTCIRAAAVLLTGAVFAILPLEAVAGSAPAIRQAASQDATTTGQRPRPRPVLRGWDRDQRWDRRA